MMAGDQVLGRDTGEVGDVLGEQGEPVRDSRREDVKVGPTSKTELGRRVRLDARTAQRLCQRRRIHLVEEQPQAAGARRYGTCAAVSPAPDSVSLRCSSMRIAISSG